MEWATFLTGGGAAGLIWAISAALKQVTDSRKDKRKGKREDVSSSVTDAATANAVVLKSLHAVEQQNESLRNEVARLRSDIASRDNKISELQTQLDATKKQIATMQATLDSLSEDDE